MVALISGTCHIYTYGNEATVSHHGHAVLKFATPTSKQLNMYHFCPTSDGTSLIAISGLRVPHCGEKAAHDLGPGRIYTTNFHF
jgi:hypothetical protein